MVNFYLKLHLSIVGHLEKLPSSKAPSPNSYTDVSSRAKFVEAGSPRC